MKKGGNNPPFSSESFQSAVENNKSEILGIAGSSEHDLFKACCIHSQRHGPVHSFLTHADDACGKAAGILGKEGLQSLIFNSIGTGHNLVCKGNSGVLLIGEGSGNGCCNSDFAVIKLHDHSACSITCTVGSGNICLGGGTGCKCESAEAQNESKRENNS